jgi:hypothetical protein
MIGGMKAKYKGGDISGSSRTGGRACAKQACEPQKGYHVADGVC